MNILFASSECFPFIKIGGLADVVGALPKSLKRFRNDVRVVLPKYRSIPEVYAKQMERVLETHVYVDWRKQYVGVYKLEYNKVIYYFIDNEYYFGARDRVYDYEDEGERFAFFQKAILEAFKYLDFKFDIIHANDWHTGMIPHLIKSVYRFDYPNVKTVYTIHNIAYQGVFPLQCYKMFNVEFDSIFEYQGCINFLKAGIAEADLVTTVSETYADEILDDYYGFGMQNILRQRKDDLLGIINGLDYSVFDPKKDKILPKKYTVDNFEEGKVAAKEELYKRLGVDFYTNCPMIAIVSRLVSQKGLDLISHIMEEILDEYKIKFIILGSGESRYEDYFRRLEEKYPWKVKSYIGYSDELAHLIYAASDIFLMPSRFEPCGLGQLIALKYGSLPLVRETGGLKDSVQPYNEYELTGNGFSFTHYNAHDMMYVLKYALRTYNLKSHWNELVRNAMTADYSWNASAKKYNEAYKKLLKK